MRTPTPPSFKRGAGLRSTITVAVILIAALGVAASLFLVELTSLLRRSSEESAAALWNLRLVEAAEVDLLLHSRARDRAVRAAHEGEILRRLEEASEHVASDLERETLARARADVERYLRPFRESGAPEDSDGALAAAFASLEALLDINATQSRIAAARAVGTDRLANMIGIAAVAGAAALVGVLVWWLWRRALSPILELEAVMKRFGGGDRGARAGENGVAELASIGRRFNEMTDELARRREEQMTFLAGVAHDLRNPLGPMKAAVALLAKDRQGTKTNATVLRVLERQVDHLERLIVDLLETARIEAGQCDLRIEEVDARLLAEEAVELFRFAAGSIAFELSTPPDPVLLRCDPTRLQRVLYNLISNAIKYSGDGRLVAVKVCRGPSAEVSFTVEDRGVGISEQDRGSLFEPYRRTGRAERSPVPGEGLGLFVARRIVEAHAGSLEVRSIEGQGSTFRVDLPARRSADATALSANA